jgi:hypothetical protein
MVRFLPKVCLLEKWTEAARIRADVNEVLSGLC